MRDSTHWLAGRVAVVTGPSRGIGAATAEALAGTGAHVVLAARDREALDCAAQHVRSAGGSALPVPTDVCDSSDVERLFAAAGRARSARSAGLRRRGTHIRTVVADLIVALLDSPQTQASGANIPLYSNA